MEMVLMAEQGDPTGYLSIQEALQNPSVSVPINGSPQYSLQMVSWVKIIDAPQIEGQIHRDIL